MLTHLLKTAWRTLLRHRAHALINVAGLATGMACCMLILLYVRHELRFDRFNAHADRIYRVVQGQVNAMTPFPLAEVAAAGVPEVEGYVRISSGFHRQLGAGDRRWTTEEYRYVDPQLLQVFSFPVVAGDPVSALSAPDGLVLSREAAERWFPAGAVGQRLRVGNEHERVVTAVVDIPSASHVGFECAASTAAARQELWDEWFDHWGMYDLATYLLLRPGSDPVRTSDKITAAIAGPLQERNPELGTPSILLQPLTDIHLRSRGIKHELQPQSDIATVYALSAIAVVVLLIACLNFMNLSTARASERAREVGMRKVVGAGRGQLVRQFLGESLLLSLFAFAVALALAELLLPAFNATAGTRLALLASRDWGTVGLFAGLALAVGLGAGAYPALFLSAFSPVAVWHGRWRPGGALPLRRLLVLVQFAITSTLLVGAGIVQLQMRYLREARLGFDQERLVAFDLPDLGRREALKEKLAAHPGIVSVSSSNHIPPNPLGHSTVYHPPGREDEDMWTQTVLVDWQYFETLGVDFVEGRPFRQDVRSDSSDALILNQAAVRWFGLTDPLGTPFRIGWHQHQGQVIGVVEDFHFETLHEPIKPIVFLVDKGSCWRMVVRLRPADVAGTMGAVREAWDEVYPEWLFSYRLVDQAFGATYRDQERVGRLVSVAGVLAIAIACMGLWGLTSFSTERRTREIGIRKAVGASAGSLVVLLSRELTVLVVVASLLGWPVAWWAMRQWLAQFAYRVEVAPGIFMAVAAAALVVAWLTVSWQTLRAALADPVRALRYE